MAITRISTCTDASFAQPLELALLQRPQQLGLQIQRHLSDFVQKNGAAIGRFELARPAGHRAGKCAAPMAEKLALQQRLRNRRAVHGDERLVAAIAGVVNESRQQFLAGSAFRFDQHIGAGAGRRARPLQSPHQQRGTAHNLAVDCFCFLGRSGYFTGFICCARCITCAAVACS